MTTECIDTDHEHCPLHGCVQYVCCVPTLRPLNANELSTMLSVLSLMTTDYRDVLVPSEIDGDTLDALHDRVLELTKAAVGL